MTLHETGHRLFVGCRRPARLVIIDTVAGKPVADLEISGDIDDLFFDAKRPCIYVSCVRGYIDVIQRRDGDRYERIAAANTKRRADELFLSRTRLTLPRRAAARGQDAELRIYQSN